MMKKDRKIKASSASPLNYICCSMVLYVLSFNWITLYGIYIYWGSSVKTLKDENAFTTTKNIRKMRWKITASLKRVYDIDSKEDVDECEC